MMSDECLELLMDCVNQGCLEDDEKLCTMALSSYEQALEYLVKIGKAEWVEGKEGVFAKWIEEGEQE